MPAHQIPDEATSPEPSPAPASTEVSPAEAGWRSPVLTARFVLNPLIAAEIRRWRARPFSYGGMLVFVFVSICLLLYSQQIGGWFSRVFGARGGGLFGALPSADNLRQAFGGDLGRIVSSLWQLIIRPSTLLPVMMVWRALVSLREPGLYEPFRLTYLSPAEFLWGIVAVPFFISSLILIGYTGIVIGPRIIDSYYYSIPGSQGTLFYTQIVAGILLEGSANGALISFVALFYGIRGKARLSALMPLVVAVFVIQLAQALAFIHWDHIQQFLRLPRLPFAEIPKDFDQRWRYLLIGAVKLVLAIGLYGITLQRLSHPPER